MLLRKATTMGLSTLALALTVGCSGGTNVRDGAPPPVFADERLDIPTQGLVDFELAYSAQASSTVPSTIETAHYELVVDGKVVKAGDEKLGVTLAPGKPVAVRLSETSRYVADANSLKALDNRAGSLLVAMRGHFEVKSEGGGVSKVEFARSRNLRLPRLPKVVLKDADAGRYSPTEVNGTVYVGVMNPNPFPIKLSELSFEMRVAGTKITDGIRGQGDGVSAGATGVFEVPFSVSETTYGASAGKLIAGRNLPYEVKGELKGDLFATPYALDGELRLNVSR